MLSFTSGSIRVELNANDDWDNSNHDQRLFLLQMQRDENRFSGIYLSAFVHGKKGIETGNSKINRNQETLNTDIRVLRASQEKWKLSVRGADSLRLPEQLHLEIWWYCSEKQTLEVGWVVWEQYLILFSFSTVEKENTCQALNITV